MLVLGIESSCDECAASIVEDGRHIKSNVIATQIEIHRPYNGVVPEIASRMHTEMIIDVVREAFSQASLKPGDIHGIAVTSRPGLVGSLLVGLSFAKGYAYSLGLPWVGVDHIRAHLYAAHLESEIKYPYLGLLVSGGHTIICRVEDFDDITVMGTTIDDACGEAFDKVAKFYELGFPGGVAIDRLSKEGNPRAFNFPGPSLHKGDHRYDVSYSGLKTAVVNQLEQFHDPEYPVTPANIAASFQKTAINILLKRLDRAVEDTGIKKVVAGEGVAANSYLRSEIAKRESWDIMFPSLKLCTDNGAMIAGIGFHYLERGQLSDFSHNASARVPGFRRAYP